MLGLFLNSWQGDELQWGVLYLWRSMGLLCRGTVVLLALMLVQTVVIVLDRLSRYRAARKQSRAFLRDASLALRDGKLGNAIAIAAQNPRSHIAAVVSPGLASFASTRTQFTHVDAVAACERAMQRSRDTASAGLRVGLNTLASIAANSPFVGLFGTVIGILGAFKGCSGQRAMCMAALAEGLAEALVTTALGLFVAIPAVWFRDYLRSRMEVFETEMSNAVLETETLLQSHRLKSFDVPGTKTTTLFEAADTAAARAWEIPYDRSRVLLGALGACVLFLVSLIGYATYKSAIWWHSYTEYVPDWELVGGQETVSPDNRYRAVVPAIYRRKLGASGGCECDSSTRIALRIFPHNRAQEWRPQACPTGTQYALEPDNALLMCKCAIPYVMWRSNDELLVQCSECSSEDLRLFQGNAGWPRITVIGRGGQRLHPEVLPRIPQCSEP